jgi:hypothetical protein
MLITRDDKVLVETLENNRTKSKSISISPPDAQ